MPKAAEPTKTRLVLDAALELFSERGYGGTPVPEVAERAGVSVGTIYRYFPGKQGVVNALYRHWKQQFVAELLHGVDLDGPPEDVFTALWQRLAAFAADHSGAFAFLETHHHGSYLDHESRALAAEIDDAMDAVVTSWQRSGAVRDGNPAVLRALAFGAFVGAFRQQRLTGESATTGLGEQTQGAAWSLLAVPTN